MTRLTMLAAVVAAATLAPARAATPDPLLPAESQQVFRLNIKQILESDLIKKYALAQIKQAMDGADAQKTMKELGLDPLKDLESVSGGFWGDDPKEMHGLAILRGKFDPAKLFEAAEKAAKKDGDKVAIVKEGDYTFVKVVVDNVPEPIYATVADDKTILVGSDKKMVIAGMKAAEAKTAKAELKPEVAALVEVMDDKASMYFCGISNGKVGEIPPNPVFDDVEKLKKQLAKMESSAMTLRVTGDVSVEMVMGMKDGDSADDFGSTVEELLGKARLFLPIIAMQQQQFKPIVDDLKKTLKSKVNKKQIVVSMKLTGDSIGKAAGSDE